MKNIYLLLLGLISLSVASGVFAFTEPALSPPQNNVAAPLHVGGAGQSKSGGLILNTGGAATGLVVQTGNVGIGTASPGNTLDVRGMIVAKDADADFVQLWKDNSIIFGRGGSIGGLRFGSATDLNATNYVEHIRISDSGNVGIGTTNPRAKMDVAGNAYIGGGGTGNLLTINTANQINTSGGLAIQAGAAGSAYILYDRQGSWAGKLYIGNNANGGSNSPTTAITIDGTNGNAVGIGIVSPGAKLDVNGSILTRGSGIEGGEIDLQDGDNTNSWNIDNYGNTNGEALRFFRSTGQVAMSIASNGDLILNNKLCLGGVCNASWPGGGGQWTTIGNDIQNTNSGSVKINGNLNLNGHIITGVSVPNVISLQNPSSGANSSYIQWMNGGIRQGYMGWEPGYLNLTLENGYNFGIMGGNVSIGTTNPGGSKLKVAGELKADWIHATAQGNNTFAGNVSIGGKIRAGGYPDTTGNVEAYSMEIGGSNPTSGSGQATIYLHHHGVIAHQLRYNNGTLFLEAAGNGYGTNGSPSLSVGGSASIGGTISSGNALIGGTYIGGDNILFSGVNNAHVIGSRDSSTYGGTIRLSNSTYAGGDRTVQIGGWNQIAPFNPVMTVDPVNNRVGIGTQSPNAPLQITAPNWVAMYMTPANTMYGWQFEVRDLGGGNVPLILFAKSASTYTTSLHLTQNGKMSVGGGIDPSANVTFAVFGAAGKTDGSIYWTTVSDERLKKNINPLGYGLNKILQLRGVSYEWKKPEDHADQTGIRMGFIAQEVEGVFPEWVSEDKDGMKSINISGFEALVVESMRELKDEINGLKEENNALRARVEQLETR